MIDNTSKVLEAYYSWQTLVAVIFGIMLQILLGEKKGRQLVITVGISSIFVALFIVPTVIDILGINPSGNYAITLYALSALVSVEILAALIKILPKAISVRTKRFLGVENDTE